MTGTDPGKTALVVDDDPVFRYAFARVVRLYGWTSGEASNADEALRYCRELKPRVVFLDLLMPGMDGFETCAALRAEPGCAASTIIAISGLARHSIEERALRSGFDLFLVKPVSENLLRAVLGERVR
jgi:CheY-like chemotaxis protein